MKHILVIGLLLYFSPSSNAQLAVNPCEADIQKFCQATIGKKGDVVECLQKNKEKLSTACKAHDASMGELMKDLKPPCQEDYQKFCSQKQPYKGYVVSCLAKNKKSLSTKCKKEMGL